MNILFHILVFFFANNNFLGTNTIEEIRDE